MKKVIILVFVSLFPLLDLLHPGIPKGHDTPDHVARIANFYTSLSEGNLIPRWAGNLNWGYGHPILMFLYPFPSYAASLFHGLGFSLVDSTKLVFVTSYVASILAMFFFARAAWGTWSGVAAAILYGFAPYRFVDLYVRGAIGEHVAFVFPPIILWGMLHVARRSNRYSMSAVALGFAGLILSHNAVALMVLPLVILYGVYLYFFEAKKQMNFLVRGSWCLVLGSLISAFFWVPAFFEGKYTLRDIVTKGDFITRFVPLQSFFVSAWNYGGGNEFTKQVGAVQWVSIFGGFILFVRTKSSRLRWFIGGSAVLIVASLWFMTVGSTAIWESVTILQKFQFPWRLLTVVALVSSVFSAIVIAHAPKRFMKLLTVVFIGAAVLSTRGMWRAKEYTVRPEEYYSGIYESTTDTGESSPIWSVRFMERRPKAMYEVIEGNTTITPGFRNTTRHEFTVTGPTEARIVDNTLYFPGWSVVIDDQKIPVEFQDPTYRGLMTFRVSAGEHRIVVDFGETKLRKMANVLSLSGLIIFVFYETFRRYRYI